MFCKNCGAQTGDTTQFCTKCGSPCNAPQGTQSTAAPANASEIRCPHCQGTNLHPVVENNVSSMGGGYGVGKGCLGYICLGPLGLLCGLCGNKQKISTSSQTFWLCQNCGYKFQSRQDAAAAEREQQQQQEQVQKTCRVIGTVLAVIASLFLIGSLINGLTMLQMRSNVHSLFGANVHSFGHTFSDMTGMLIRVGASLAGLIIAIVFITAGKKK